MTSAVSQPARQEPTAAEVIVDALAAEDVGTVFGVQGGAALPVFDALETDDRVDVVPTAHEQGAAFAADGYARVAGRPGVCLVTSGPGALNTLTGLGTAHMDSVPLVALTGQVPTEVMGTDAFQEADALGASRSVTKWRTQVEDPRSAPAAVTEALERAGSGRVRPTLVDLPKDVTSARAGTEASHSTETRESRRRSQSRPSPDPQAIEAAADLLSNARRPMILAGHGVRLAGAEDELAALASKLAAPVATTLLGLGAFPEGDPLALGMIGMHGTSAANTAQAECDVLLVVGARLDDRATGDPDRFAPQADLIHLDLDPDELGKILEPAVALQGDAGRGLALLSAELGPRAGACSAWRERARTLANGKQPPVPGPRRGRIAPQAVVDQIDRHADDDAIVATGVGQHQMWTALHFEFGPDNDLLTSGGLGSMGYGLPAAIGAHFAAPERQLVVVDGDGCLQMTGNELATAARFDVPVAVFVLNNAWMGMVRQWQDLFHDGRRAASSNHHVPSFAELAETYGAKGVEVSRPDELEPAVEAALAYEEGPVVVDVHVAEAENVYPMVPPGSANDEFLREGQA